MPQPPQPQHQAPPSNPSPSPSPSLTPGPGLLPLLPLLLLAAMGIISLARGRPPLLAAWPACAPLAEGDSSSTTTGGGGSHVPTPLHVPVFLTPSPGSNPEEARRAALSALKRAHESYRQELVVRMKALERMALDSLHDWRGHGDAPGLTAGLQRRVWGGNADGDGDGGFCARLPACWEANERVLDRLLRLPEVTVGLPLPVPVPVTGSESKEGDWGEGGSTTTAVPPLGGDGSAGNSSSSNGSSTGTGAGTSGGDGSVGGGYSDGVQVLTHLLRDWAAEGKEVRRRTYGPIVRVVRRLFQQGRGDGDEGGKGSGPRVLVPGAGLGRLAFELAYGHHGGGGGGCRVTALDVSPVMVAAAAGVLASLVGGEGGRDQDQDQEPLLEFFPFVHDPLLNQRSHAARFRGVAAPDGEARRLAARQWAAAAAAAAGSSPSSSLSLEVGGLLAHAAARPGGYDAVVTCFFVDTGRHPLDYLWAIRRLLRPGGYWVNLGPLNYHAQLPEGGVQLTLEDLEWAAAEMGLAPQREWALVPEPCAYRPEPFGGGEGGSAFLRRDVYHPAFGVYRREG